MTRDKSFSGIKKLIDKNHSKIYIKNVLFDGWISYTSIRVYNYDLNPTAVMDIKCGGKVLRRYFCRKKKDYVLEWTADVSFFLNSRRRNRFIRRAVIADALKWADVFSLCSPRNLKIDKIKWEG